MSVPANASSRRVLVLAMVAAAAVTAGCGADGAVDEPVPRVTSGQTQSSAPTPSDEPTHEPEGTPAPTTAEEVPGPTASATPTASPDAAPAPPPSLAPVDVVTTWSMWDPSAGTAGEAQVAGYVAGVVEDGGTCYLTLTSGDDVVEGSAAAVADAAATSCGAVSVPRSAIPHGGDWNAVLRYVSPTSSGAAPAVPIGIP